MNQISQLSRQTGLACANARIVSLARLQRLGASGADFGVMASNTPHHRYSAIVTGVEIPVLNMFEAVARRCRLEGHREVLILGTALTMRSQVLRDAFTAQDIEASAPVDSDNREAALSLISKLQRGDSEGAAQSVLTPMIESGIGNRSFGVAIKCFRKREIRPIYGESKASIDDTVNL
jgi:aspartate/glutamate racemase